MTMDGDIEQSNCTERASPSASSWSAWAAPVPGWPSGCGGIERRGGPGCGLAAEPLSGNGIAPPSASSRASWRFARPWSSRRRDERGLPASGPRSSSSSCDTNACGRCRRSARSSASSGGTGYPKRRPRRRKGGGEPYPAPRARQPGDVQQTDLVGPRHLRGPRGSPASIRCIPWPSWAGASRPPRGATRPPSCCASILCTHGAGLGLLGSRRWITRWPRPAEADTPIASRWSCACICSWASISSSSRRGNRGATRTSRASTISGKSGCSAIPVTIFGLSDAPARHSCATTISPSPTAPCRSAATAPGIPDRGWPGTALTSGPCPPRSRWPRIETPTAASGCPWPAAACRSSAASIPRAPSTLTASATSLGRRLVGRYVTATIFTHRRMLVVKVGARRYKRFPFPIPEPLVAAIVPLPRGRS